MTTFGKQIRTKNATWNVHALKMTQLAIEANRLKLNILGLSKICWNDFGGYKLTSWQVLLYSSMQGLNFSHKKGVGFLPSPDYDLLTNHSLNGIL